VTSFKYFSLLQGQHLFNILYDNSSQLEYCLTFSQKYVIKTSNFISHFVSMMLQSIIKTNFYLTHFLFNICCLQHLARVCPTCHLSPFCCCCFIVISKWPEVFCLFHFVFSYYFSLVKINSLSEIKR
jgi:hypothetical protein